MRSKTIITPINHEAKRKESLEFMNRIHGLIMLRNPRSKHSFKNNFSRGSDKKPLASRLKGMPFMFKKRNY